MSEWTLEQVTELLLEQMLSLLDGCADDDVVRPQLVWEAMHKAWVPTWKIEPLPDDLTAGDLRSRVQQARHDLAAGELVP